LGTTVLQGIAARRRGTPDNAIFAINTTALRNRRSRLIRRALGAPHVALR
jgi:hypothetical protein